MVGLGLLANAQSVQKQQSLDSKKKFNNSTYKLYYLTAMPSFMHKNLEK